MFSDEIISPEQQQEGFHKMSMVGAVNISFWSIKVVLLG